MPKDLVFTSEQQGRLAALLMTVDAAVTLLPEAEQQAYRDAQESVIRARREAERVASEIWIG